MRQDLAAAPRAVEPRLSRPRARLASPPSPPNSIWRSRRWRLRWPSGRKGRRGAFPGGLWPSLTQSPQAAGRLRKTAGARRARKQRKASRAGPDQKRCAAIATTP